MKHTTFAATSLFMTLMLAANIATAAPTPIAQIATPKNAAECLTLIKKGNADFVADYNAGAKAGKIDKNEAASIKKIHDELMDIEKKAAADKSLSGAECKAVLVKQSEQHAVLVKALSTGAPAPAPAPAPSKPVPPAAVAMFKTPGECLATIKKGNADFLADYNAGVKAGKIDKTEAASIKKIHEDLIAAEKKASADSKLSTSECMGILTMQKQQHEVLAKALK